MTEMATPDRIPAWRRRRMPDLWAIASYWAEREVFRVDLTWPHCFGCRTSGPLEDDDDNPPSDRALWRASSSFLDRAHLVDRMYGGLDGPQNLVPLCTRCHRLMPVHRLGDGPAAIKWVQDGGRLALRRSGT